MAFFAFQGALKSGQVNLVNGGLSGTLITGMPGYWVDVYSIVISTNETAGQSIQVTDGTLTLNYFTGGAVPNPAILDQGSIPVRFGKGLTITCNAGAVTAGKTISVMIRGLARTS